VINGPTRATVGESVAFNPVGSTVAEGSSIVSNAWTFGDGATANGVYVSHVYNTPGLYEVTLTVTDDQGQQSTTNAQIEIIEAAPGPTVTPVPTPEPDQPPVAVITAPSEALVGQPVTFDASNSQSASPIVSYAWQFGDGGTANAVTVQHAYARPGVYNVILTVTDDQNLSGTSNQQIQITEAPPPTSEPTQEPTIEPTQEPTVEPTEEPTAEPPPQPTEENQ
jgi:PKD repeat protein